MVGAVRLYVLGPSNPFADVQRRRKGNAGVLKVQPSVGVLLQPDVFTYGLLPRIFCAMATSASLRVNRP